MCLYAVPQIIFWTSFVLFLVSSWIKELNTICKDADSVFVGDSYF